MLKNITAYVFTVFSLMTIWALGAGDVTFIQSVPVWIMTYLCWITIWKQRDHTSWILVISLLMLMINAIGESLIDSVLWFLGLVSFAYNDSNAQNDKNN